MRRHFPVRSEKHIVRVEDLIIFSDIKLPARAVVNLNIFFIRIDSYALSCHILHIRDT